jgi:hypothetical protein
LVVACTIDPLEFDLWNNLPMRYHILLFSWPEWGFGSPCIHGKWPGIVCMSLSIMSKRDRQVLVGFVLPWNSCFHVFTCLLVQNYTLCLLQLLFLIGMASV